jgi:hypothetical protein
MKAISNIMADNLINGYVDDPMDMSLSYTGRWEKTRMNLVIAVIRELNWFKSKRY